MTITMTPDQLKEKISSLGTMGHVAILHGMTNAAIGVTGKAKKNCTPGESPYDPMVFPSKLFKVSKAGNISKRQWELSPNMVNRSGAPFDLGDLRRSINYKVVDDGEVITGVVGTKLGYSSIVHDGTSKIQARPFIYDAIMSEKDNTDKCFIDAVDLMLLQVSQGDLFYSPVQSLGSLPTMSEDEEGEI